MGELYDIWDNSAMDYIGQLENAKKVGLKDGIWRPPTQPGYDKYQIGMGLDTRAEHNPIVYNYLKSKGRLNDPWLTESEEKDLRAQTYATKKNLVRRLAAQYGDGLSELGYSRIAGMVWHGDPALKMRNQNTTTGSAFKRAALINDNDLQSVFDAYYKYPANRVRYQDRYKNDVAWADQWNKTSQLVNSIKFKPEYNAPAIMQPRQIQQDYNLNNPAPTSISSWSGSGSPAYGGYDVRIPSFIETSNKPYSEIKQIIAPTL